MSNNLASVFLIGDSISCCYTDGVKTQLADVANVERAPDNCGDTRRGVEQLDNWLDGRNYDIIHFNWGLHDVCYRNPENTTHYGNRDKVDGTLSVDPQLYRTNLEKLVIELKVRAKQLIWAATTYVPDSEAGRIQGDEIKYNAIAAEIMEKHSVPINDLHKLTASFDASLFTCPGDVHYTEEGTARLAEAVALFIREYL